MKNNKRLWKVNWAQWPKSTGKDHLTISPEAPSGRNTGFPLQTHQQPTCWLHHIDLFKESNTGQSASDCRSSQVHIKGLPAFHFPCHPGIQSLLPLQTHQQPNDWLHHCDLLPRIRRLRVGCVSRPCGSFYGLAAAKNIIHSGEYKIAGIMIAGLH